MKNANKPKKCIPSEDSLALSWYDFGAGGLFLKKTEGLFLAPYVSDKKVGFPRS